MREEHRRRVLGRHRLPRGPAQANAYFGQSTVLIGLDLAVVGCGLRVRK